jgi:hypothetical protein
LTNSDLDHIFDEVIAAIHHLNDHDHTAIFAHVPARALVVPLADLIVERVGAQIHTVETFVARNLVIIVMPGGLRKSRYERPVCAQIEEQNPDCTVGSTPVVLSVDRFGRPASVREVNIGVFCPKVSDHEMNHPKEFPYVPVPRVWGEAFFHYDPSDRLRALSKPGTLTECGHKDTEFFAVSLPDSNFVSPPRPRPGTSTRRAIPLRKRNTSKEEVIKNIHPGPYILHYRKAAMEPEVYDARKWNEYVQLEFGYQLRMEHILELYEFNPSTSD